MKRVVLILLLLWGTAWSDVAPDFSLPLADGGTMRLSSLRGRPVVLTFWAFWCTTWQEVTAGYRELAAHHAPAHLIVVAVDPTRAELLHDPQHGFERFFPIMIDQHRAVSQQYQVDCVPTVLVLDAKGNVCWRARGWPGTAPIQDAIKRAWQEAALRVGRSIAE